MRQLVYLLAALAALGPPCAYAQMQPHRAEYALRLGTAANAPRIGSAVQDLSQDCGGWHLKRDITTEIAPIAQFWYAEDYHQQYLAKVPNGYCGLGGTGVSCPVGLTAAG